MANWKKSHRYLEHLRREAVRGGRIKDDDGPFYAASPAEKKKAVEAEAREKTQRDVWVAALPENLGNLTLNRGAWGYCDCYGNLVVAFPQTEEGRRCWRMPTLEELDDFTGDE